MFLLHCKNLQDISRKSPQCVVSNVKEGPFSGFFFFLLCVCLLKWFSLYWWNDSKCVYLKPFIIAVWSTNLSKKDIFCESFWKNILNIFFIYFCLHMHLTVQPAKQYTQQARPPRATFPLPYGWIVMLTLPVSANCATVAIQCNWSRQASHCFPCTSVCLRWT